MGKAYITSIYIIEDDLIYGRILQKNIESNGNYDVTLFQTGIDYLSALNSTPDIVSIDCNLPDLSGLELLQKTLEFNDEIPCIMLSGQEDINMVVQCYRNGARDYIVKNTTAPQDLLASILKFTKIVTQKKELEDLKSQIINRVRYQTLLGESNSILSVIRLLQKVEKTEMMVLITGESGTGKEVVAKSIHVNSRRYKESYVTVNMAAIPVDLIESELFGHEKGAFTGADSRRIGKFEEANFGSIFLDEIGEMDLLLQTKLLRVLQEKTITRVGSNKEIKLNVRVIAATNKDLLKMVKEGKFREDLYYRLQGFLIHLPPLRDRGNDVLILANHFLKSFDLDNKVIAFHSISNAAIQKLLAHNWPGNVRELKNVVERSTIIADEVEIQDDDIIIH
ncbi:MAG: sigma-54 dependent transcriptional regulator [Bacteroidota bacterium]|nr:sigma-54 dependent transcriptional regulator [Bacteroidota bacterium]